MALFKIVTDFISVLLVGEVKVPTVVEQTIVSRVPLLEPVVADPASLQGNSAIFTKAEYVVTLGRHKLRTCDYCFSHTCQDAIRYKNAHRRPRDDRHKNKARKSEFKRKRAAVYRTWAVERPKKEIEMVDKAVDLSIKKARSWAEVKRLCDETLPPLADDLSIVV